MPLGKLRILYKRSFSCSKLQLINFLTVHRHFPDSAELPHTARHRVIDLRTSLVSSKMRKRKEVYILFVRYIQYLDTTVRL